MKRNETDVRREASQLGTVEVCPYCHEQLPKIPKRKAKCKSCKKSIFPRVEPLSGESRLVREGDLFLVDEIKALSEGWWLSWYEQNHLILEARADLAQEWGLDVVDVSIEDAKWRSNNSAIVELSEKGDFQGVFYTYIDMLRSLQYRSEAKKAPLAELIGGAIVTGYWSAKNEHEKLFADHNLQLDDMSPTIGRPQYMLFEMIECSGNDEFKAAIINTSTVKSYTQLLNISFEQVWDWYVAELRSESDDVNLLEEYERNKSDPVTFEIHNDYSLDENKDDSDTSGNIAKFVIILSLFAFIGYFFVW